MISRVLEGAISTADHKGRSKLKLNDFEDKR